MSPFPRNVSREEGPGDMPHYHIALIEQNTLGFSRGHFVEASIRFGKTEGEKALARATPFPILPQHFESAVPLPGPFC